MPGGVLRWNSQSVEVERERIYRTGGTVQRGMGPARVNGDLAVSRAFGDKDHKRTGGPGPEDRSRAAHAAVLRARVGQARRDSARAAQLAAAVVHSAR